jgi:hypothetical protein
MGSKSTSTVESSVPQQEQAAADAATRQALQVAQTPQTFYQGLTTAGPSTGEQYVYQTLMDILTGATGKPSYDVMGDYGPLQNIGGMTGYSATPQVSYALQQNQQPIPGLMNQLSNQPFMNMRGYNPRQLTRYT